MPVLPMYSTGIDNDNRRVPRSPIPDFTAAQPGPGWPLWAEMRKKPILHAGNFTVSGTFQMGNGLRFLVLFECEWPETPRWFPIQLGSLCR